MLSNKDKGARRMLQQRGIEAEKIFDAPILLWILLSFIPLLALLELLIGFYWLIYIISPWYLFSLFFAFHQSNSLAIGQGNLYILNSHFPFRRFRQIKLSSIQCVTFRVVGGKWKEAFLFFRPNYIVIQSGNEKIEVPCLGLLEDDFDGNFTDLTIDDLRFALEERGVAIEWLLE